MNQDLQSFLLLMLRAVLPALLVVAITAFLTVPLSLGYHPGEKDAAAITVSRHMT